MDWNRQEVLSLIEAYRKRSLIWDTKNSLYFNKALKQAAWEDLGRDVQKPAKECKKKMEYLLSALRREKMKMKRSLENGEEKVYSSSWFAFESLKFLWEKNKQGQLLSLGQPSSEDCKTTKALLVKRVPTSRPESQQAPRKKARQNFGIHPSAYKFQTPRTSTFSSLHEDECYHFGNLVALKLRGYNDNTRCAIQNDIMGIFLRASQGFYEDIFSTSAREFHPGGAGSPSHHGSPPGVASSDSIVSAESTTQLCSEVTVVKLELSPCPSPSP